MKIFSILLGLYLTVLCSNAQSSPNYLLFAKEYAGHAKSVYEVGAMLGAWQGSDDKILERLDEISRQIVASEQRLVSWLENGELRRISGSVAAGPRNFRDYMRTKNVHSRRALIANLVTQINIDTQMIRQNLERFDVEGGSDFYVAYAGLLALNGSLQKSLYEALRVREKEESFKFDVGEKAAFLHISERAKFHLRKMVVANFKLHGLQISSGGGRIRGYSVVTQPGYLNFGSFVPVGDQIRYYDMGEKTEETPEIRARIEREREQVIKPAYKAAGDAMNLSIEAKIKEVWNDRLQLLADLGS